MGRIDVSFGDGRYDKIMAGLSVFVHPEPTGYINKVIGEESGRPTLSDNG